MKLFSRTTLLALSLTLCLSTKIFAAETIKV